MKTKSKVITSSLIALGVFHSMAMAEEASLKTKASPLAEVPGAVMLKPNGGWCWYQGPRAIVTKSGDVIVTSVSGDTYAGFDGGDLWATSWNPESGDVKNFELHDKFQKDDHNVAGLLELPDGKILAIYGKHGSDLFQRYRITKNGGDISAWTDEKTYKFTEGLHVGYTYSNVFRLSAEKGRIYNFSRSIGWNPNCTISDDNGETWDYGWRLFAWGKKVEKGDSKRTPLDGGRPYLQYASNNVDTIHFTTTEDHPRAYDNSIYHGYYREGKLYESFGKVVGDPGLEGKSDLKPNSFTKIYDGGPDRVAWTTDMQLDAQGNPYIAFSVQTDGAKWRATRKNPVSQDLRYFYARSDGKQWQVHEMAHAGTSLYAQESDYTGLVALDPNDPNTVVISTNAAPVSGEPLISKTDGKRHWEIFRGRTVDHGKSWTWEAITKDSAADNLRPIIPANPGGKRLILWGRGDLPSFTDYRLDIYGLSEDR